MEFDKVVLDGKKYQDLVKLAKEHDVYRRYAPKAELIERLLNLNKRTSETNENSLLSDVSMPSLDISDDELDDVSHPSLRNRNDKGNKSGVANKRSVLKEVNQLSSPAVQRSRKTVAFVTPELQSPSVKGPSSTKRLVRVSTPAKPVRTPVGKPARKSSRATSTPAANVTERKSRRGDRSGLNELDSTFTIQDSEGIQKKSPGTFKREGTFEITKNDLDSGLFKREGTFEIISVDNKGKKVSEVVTASGEPPSPLNVSLNRGTRSSRNSVLSPMPEAENKTPQNLSVKELCRLFEPQVETSSKKETPAVHSRSWRASIASPQLIPKSTRSSVLRASSRKSDVKSGASVTLPTTARKAFVTNRMKPAGFSRTPAKKNLSMTKTPNLKSPSVVREIQLKQQAVSAKKMMEGRSGTKSKIPPPRKVPNFSEMHSKMYSKMESLVDAKTKVLHRAQVYGNAAFPRCALVTPKIFSAEKSEKLVKEDRPVHSRPVAARQLKLPEKSKIPSRAKDEVDSELSVGVLPLSANRKSVEKSRQSPRNMLPANRLISRLPVPSTSRPVNSFDFPNKTSQIQRTKETIVTKAPVHKPRDVTSKNRNLLRNVRTNKRFELQMQHRMKLCS